VKLKFKLDSSRRVEMGCVRILDCVYGFIVSLFSKNLTKSEGTWRSCRQFEHHQRKIITNLLTKIKLDKSLTFSSDEQLENFPFYYWWDYFQWACVLGELLYTLLSETTESLLQSINLWHLMWISVSITCCVCEMDEIKRAWGWLWNKVGGSDWNGEREGGITFLVNNLCFISPHWNQTAFILIFLKCWKDHVLT
jgi:hypothetical protein